MAQFSSGMKEVTIDASYIGIPAGLGWVVSVPRAVVYLTVDWSMPERHAREKFVTLVRYFTAEDPRAGIHFFVMPEDEAFVLEWLRATVPPALAGLQGFGCGVGAVLWLSYGRPVKWLLGLMGRDLRTETASAFGLDNHLGDYSGTMSNVPPSAVR